MSGRLTSIGIAIAILLAAVGCFILAAYLVEIPAFRTFVVYSAHGPIENLFLILITIVIGIVLYLSGFTEKPYRVSVFGWLVYVLCIIFVGLFGIPAVFFLALIAKILHFMLSYFEK